MDKFPYISTLLNIQIKRFEIETIFDIGAYTGNSSVPIARTFSYANVYAIEPFHNNYCELVTRSADLDNYFVYELAISNCDGTASLFVPFDDMTQSVSLHNSSENCPRVFCSCMTLSSFCKKIKYQPGLLLINCEGSEFEIFEDKDAKSIIAESRIIDLSLHGKTFKYLSEGYAKKKKVINDYLLKVGFICIYGSPIKDIRRMYTGHIRQIWIRE